MKIWNIDMFAGSPGWQDLSGFSDGSSPGIWRFGGGWIWDWNIQTLQRSDVLTYAVMAFKVIGWLEMTGFSGRVLKEMNSLANHPIITPERDLFLAKYGFLYCWFGQEKMFFLTLCQTDMFARIINACYGVIFVVVKLPTTWRLNI